MTALHQKLAVAVSMAFALSAAAAAPAFASTVPATVFDAEVAAGIPIRFDLPNDGAMQQVNVLEQLDVELEGPDGSVGRMFLAEVDGRPATIVRMGDQLNIAFDDEAGTAHSARRTRRSTEWPIDYAGARDLLFPSEEYPEPGRREATSTEGKALHVWIFLHDAAGENDHARFLNWYTAGWLREMKGKVRPDVPVRVSLKSRIPGVTDFDYQANQPVSDRLHDFRQVADQYLETNGVTPDSLTKHVLFVGEPGRHWNTESREGGAVLGAALNRGNAAFASNHGHRHIFAHEVGHMIGGTHEGAAVYVLHVSNMADSLFGKISNQQYTDTNRQNIRQFLKNER